LKRKVCQSYVKTRKTGDINPYNSSKIRDCLKIYTISLEYLTEEKFYPLGTTDEYFEAPYEEYTITVCGQTVILTNGELAAALLSLPEKNREIIFLYFFGDYTQQEIGEMYGRCRSTTGYQIRRTLKLLQRKMEVLSHGKSEPFAL
jgi:DNA-directed RNA polymerase specialized sigma24 family protein